MHVSTCRMSQRSTYCIVRAWSSGLKANEHAMLLWELAASCILGDHHVCRDVIGLLAAPHYYSWMWMFVWLAIGIAALSTRKWSELRIFHYRTYTHRYTVRSGEYRSMKRRQTGVTFETLRLQGRSLSITRYENAIRGTRHGRKNATSIYRTK